MGKQVFTVVRLGDGAPVTLVTAQVDLDLNTEQAARGELARLHSGTGPVVVDASAVFVALIGLRLLLTCVEQLRRSGRPVELVVSRHLKRVAHLFGPGPGELRLTVPDALDHVRQPNRTVSEMDAERTGTTGAGQDGSPW